MLLSFVIPCYRSARTIGGVTEEIRATMAARPALDYEIVLVCDGSPDNVYEVICGLSAADAHIRGILLAKNFGQQAATMAGLRAARGDVVLVLDDDGQTPANESLFLVDALDADTDVAYASYRWRHKMHSPFRNFGSWMNEQLLHVLLHKPRALEITSFWAAKRYIVDALCSYTGPYPYTEGLILRTTNRIVNVPVRHRAREQGESGYTFSKLLGMWLNGFTAFSVVPLRVASFAGAVCAVCGFVYMLVVVIQHFIDSEVPMGYSSLMAMMLLLSGVVLILLGMLGEYVGRLYLTANATPQYVVREQTEPKL